MNPNHVRPSLPLFAMGVTLLCNPSAASPQVGDFEGDSSYDTGDWSLGRWPETVAVDDFNGDGCPDLALTHSFAHGTLALMFNRGDGSYAERIHLPQPMPSVGIVAEDLDGDGDVDLCCSMSGTNWEGKKLALHENLGGGQFAPVRLLDAPDGPAHLIAVDLDRDGDPELVVAGYGNFGAGSSIGVLDNLGGLQFGPLDTLASGIGPYRLASGDLDGDMRPEVVVAGEDGYVSLFRNGPSGLGPVELHKVHGLGMQHGSRACIAVHDQDGDGHLDVLYSSSGTRLSGPGSDGAVAVLHGDGLGNLGAKQLLPIIPWETGATSMDLADLDGDGLMDLVVTFAFESGWSWIPGIAGGGFGSGEMIAGGENLSDVATTDVNGDGWVDVVALGRDSRSVSVHLGGIGGIQPAVGPPFLGFAQWMDSGDFDLDGDLDVVASGGYAGGGTVELMENLGQGNFAATRLIGSGTDAREVKFRDLNGDGYLDVLYADGLTATGGYDFWTVINDTQGGFLAPVEWPVGTCGNGDVEAFDVDGDQDLDVCLSEWAGCGGSSGAGGVYVCLNDGSGAFGPPTRWVSPYLTQRIDHADFDRDGNEDLAVDSAAGILIGFGRGDGTFDPPQLIALDGGVWELRVGDLSGDGIPDLVAAGSTQETFRLRVLLGTGSGQFGPVSEYQAAAAFQLEFADVDEDGDVDVLSANPVTNDMSVWRNDGTGHFLHQIRICLGFGPTDITYGDFDGDGEGDVMSPGGVPPAILSKQLVLTRGRSLVPPTPIHYCSSKPSSAGTVPRIGWIGGPSAYHGDFYLTVRSALPDRPGLFFHSEVGAAAIPFLGGTLCAQPPLTRGTPLQLDAQGRATYGMNPGASAIGTTRWVQFWYRDPMHPDGTGVGFSDALEVTFGS